MQTTHLTILSASTLFMAASLCLSACTNENETSNGPAQSTENAPEPGVTPTNASVKETPPAEPPAAEPPAAEPPATQPLAAEPPPKPAAATKRTPTFGFEPGGAIADEALTDYHVVMSASIDGADVGSMTIDLWSDRAPITVRNFLRLVDEGFYDGLTFHRIMRDFMVQGGDPTGTGTGNSPYGLIEAEFSRDPDRLHDYGVLSMARRGGQPNSASCQFFICCDPNSVKSLDGQYASFGRITGGVATLEALANVPCAGPEGSTPTKKVLITKAEVKKGPAPTGEEIKRPPIDLGGEPERVVIQHILVSFAGTGLPVTRTQEEAESLANQLFERVKGGENFETVLLANTDDPVQEGDTTPGIYQMLNHGQRNPEADTKMQEFGQEFQQAMQDLQAKQVAGEITPEQFRDMSTAARAEVMQRAEQYMWRPRRGMVPGFGDVGFKLEVGEIGMAVFDAKNSPYGWHIIKRLE